MKIKYLAVTTLALGAALYAGNSNAAVATADATATVIAPIAINSTVDLVFGSFAAGAGGSVTVSTSGLRTATGAIPSAVTATPTAARFDVTGDGAATYGITIAPLTELVDGANTMELAIFSDLTAGNATAGTVTVGALTNGAQSIYVGGTLTVDAGQVASSAYAGTISVDVEYN